MTTLVSVFLDFSLPNAATWFYFSFLLAMALFFKFNRLLSIRNWDVVTAFLLVPGLLLLQQAHGQRDPTANLSPADIAQLVGLSSQAATAPFGAAGIASVSEAVCREPASTWFAYLWLLMGSAYFLFRCFLDLSLVRRPALAPNLNSGGLGWLAVALFICLAALAYRPSPSASPSRAEAPAAVIAESGKQTVGQPTAPLQQARDSLGDSVVLVRSFAVFSHVFVIIGLIVIGGRHFQDVSAGMAAATFYLLLPYTAFYFGQWHHVWPAALIIWTVVFYRRPTLAGLFLGLAAGTAFFPVLLLPLWLSFYWRRGLGRFLFGFVVAGGVCLGVTGLILWLNNDLAQSVNATLALPDWQPWLLKDPKQEGFWQGVHWAYRLPVWIAYLALVITTALWPNPKNLAHVLALSTAVVIGIQFWFPDQGGVYILWYLPLLLLLVFRPNLAEHRPPRIRPDADWVRRLFAVLRRVYHWLVDTPDSLVGAR